MKNGHWSVEEYREYLRTGKEPTEEKAGEKQAAELERERLRLLESLQEGRSAEKKTAGGSLREGRSAESKTAGGSLRDGRGAEPKTAGGSLQEGRGAEPRTAGGSLPERRSAEKKAAGGSLADMLGAEPKKKPKYGNRKTDVNGIPFDSQHEAEVYLQLMDRVKAGELKCVMRQVRFDLGGGPYCSKESRYQYIADFVTVDPDNRVAVLDAKSEATRKDRTYINKKKQMMAEWGIEVQEV